ncbi:cyclic nucleotide-binding-like protein [Desarmillaria ectypa]|nr:cyclic nucleotide-binding-like protein [Desarmillaria ectypa]
MSTFDSLVEDLTRDANRVQPKDALQFCANWFQQRLEEQRSRTRDALARRTSTFSRDLPSEIYIDTPFGTGTGPISVSPFQQAPHRSSLRNSVSLTPGPFGTLNVPGNALLANNPMGPPTIQMEGRVLPPPSPLSMTPPFPMRDDTPFAPPTPGSFLVPPTSAIFARRTSVSAESIPLDGSDEILPVYPKTPDQLRRIRASMTDNLLFRDLEEEQITAVIGAMQEKATEKGEVIIRQGDVGDYFYVVESGLLTCYIRPEPLPPAGLRRSEDMFVQPGYHPEFGKQVSECTPGTSFGELALMYGHPRAATVVSTEASMLWALDRITFRTIILTAAHRRRTMYEHFLSTVTLLSSLDSMERSKIADALVSRVYMDGEAVVRQGEMGDTFFFVEEGEAVVTKAQEGDDGEIREFEVGHYKKGDYFGELSLLRMAPRAATVCAIHRGDRLLPKLKVAALDAPAFTRLLGPLRDLMERRAGEQYGPGPWFSG